MYKSLLALALAGLAAAETFNVKVGDHKLKFEPDHVTAAAGDVINFQVFTTHNVAQSTFDAPCKPSGDDAIYSGYMMQESFQFAVTVNDTDPVWLYCGTGHHCQAGMAFAINPTTDKTIDMYTSKAKDAGAGQNPGSVHGGVIGGGDSSSGGSSSASSGGSAPTSSPTSGGGASGSSATPSPSPSGNAGARIGSSDFLVGVPLAIWALGLFFE